MESIYLGRIVAVAVTPSGDPAILYRVSSRSFPNRQAEINRAANTVSIVPKPGFESDIRKNPYIAYNCAKVIGDVAILANGSHADPAADKIAEGMPVRDALILSLFAMDYEKDDYSTPRITAAYDAGEGIGWLGSIRHDGLDVRAFKLEPGTIVHVSTYAHDIPTPHRISPFTAETADEACDFILGGGIFKNFSNPITAVAAVMGEDGFTLATKDAAQ